MNPKKNKDSSREKDSDETEDQLSYPKDMYVRRYAELVSELAYEY
jgi:hypothetical protein